MKYIDIHSHLDYISEGKERNDALERMKEKGVGTITVGADLKRSKRGIAIAEANENVWATIGVHPEYNEDWNKAEKIFEGLVNNPKVVAIGECGLDYFKIKTNEEKNTQKEMFEGHINFSLKHNKPLMLHIRDAYDDALEIIKKYPETRGNVHFFAGNKDIAKSFLDLGFTLSFTGVITFTEDYNEVIKYIPQNMIMSETDAPWVAPVPHRGKKNEPAYVAYVVEKMAKIRRENPDVLNDAIIENAKRVFGL